MPDHPTEHPAALYPHSLSQAKELAAPKDTRDGIVTLCLARELLFHKMSNVSRN